MFWDGGEMNLYGSPLDCLRNIGSIQGKSKHAIVTHTTTHFTLLIPRLISPLSAGKREWRRRNNPWKSPQNVTTTPTTTPTAGVSNLWESSSIIASTSDIPPAAYIPSLLESPCSLIVSLTTVSDLQRVAQATKQLKTKDILAFRNSLSGNLRLCDWRPRRWGCPSLCWTEINGTKTWGAISWLLIYCFNGLQSPSFFF